MRKVPFVLSIVCLSVATGALVLRAASDDTLNVTRYEYASSKVDASLDGFRILYLSDLHNHDLTYANGSILDAIDDVNPDLVLIGGDMIDDHTTDEDFATLEKFYLHLQAMSYPAFAVSGNHEAYTSAANFERLRTIMATADVHWYEADPEKAYFKVREGLCLASISDPGWIEHDPVAFIHRVIGNVRNELEAIKEKKDDTALNIVLCHRPELFDIYQEYGYDLAYCGHTHGNQIGIPLPYSLNQIPSSYSYGRYEEKGCTLILGAGLGYSWSLPFRVGRNAEIVVTTLKAA